MANLKKFTRVVTCQGGIQLVAALAALESHEAEQKSAREYEDYLVVYDLFAPESQLKKFAEAVKRMARALRNWKSIVYVSREQMEELAAQLNDSSKPEIFERVRELVGTDHADEIYLCRNWQFGNRLLLNVYRDAFKVCYGDSIGIYFSEAYFSPAPETNGQPLKTVVRQQLSRFKNSLRYKLNAGEQRVPQATGNLALDEIEFDVGYFLLPEILGEIPPMPSKLVDKATTDGIFRRLAEALDPDQVSAEFGYLAQRPAVILMTSNFSEAERMPTRDLELAAYKDFVQQLELPRESTLIIKPHPRDSAEKIEELGSSLRDLFSDVVLLMDPNLFFIPFEVFLIQTFLGETEKTPRNLKIITFSTACLSLPILFNVGPVVGFGSEIVKRSFSKNQIGGRLRHEEDLELALQTLAKAD